MSSDIEKEIEDALQGKAKRPVKEILEDANIIAARMKVKNLRRKERLKTQNPTTKRDANGFLIRDDD